MTHYFRILIVILCIAPIAQFGTDIYVPALPEMVRYFNSTPSHLQWTITIYLLAFSFGQPLVGPLSDRYGRKPILVIGIAVFFLGSLLAVFTHALHVLDLARFIQGMGVTTVAIMLKTLAADCFTGLELVKVMSYALTAYGIGPIIAPVIGAYLTHYFSWHANFLALVVYSGFLLLLIIFSLKETNKDIRRHDLKTIWKNNVLVMMNQQFLFTCISGGICFATVYSFNVLAPFTIQGELHYSILQYGYFSLMVGLAYLLGGLLNRVLIHYVSSAGIVTTGLIFSFIVATLMLISALIFPHALWIILIPSMILVFICGIVNPHFFATAMSIFPKLIGTTGALSGFIMILTTAIVVFIITHLNAHQFKTLPTILFFTSLVSLSSYFLFVRRSIK